MSSDFTFHNVSINTQRPTADTRPVESLHSTMFLLILNAIPKTTSFS